MVHYMPWYQTPTIHGYWGYHWTMNHYNPEKIFPSGQREIASHYYPLTGPYDSSDPLILEYQSLLIKISGIDGVLVDWYGNEDYFDYGLINESTQKLFTAIQNAGLLFAIVYEDQTIKHMIDGGRINSSDAINYGKSAIKYTQDNWSNKEAYLKIDNRPVLLTFGPQYFTNSSSWSSIFSGLNVTPVFFTLDNRLNPVASGAYPWPPMWKSSNGVLTQSALNDYLTQFYQKAVDYQYLVTSAFPGFYDIYASAGVGQSYGYLDRENGNTFVSTLQKAVDHNPEIIQIVTWNDYGEGTIVEPTTQFEYQYLEMIQSLRDSLDSSFVFQNSDLALPLRIFNLRKQYAGNQEIKKAIDRVFNFIISDQIDEATNLVDSISAITDVNINEPGSPAKFYLGQNYPNPFNPTTNIEYRIVEFPESGTGGFVSLKIYDVLGREVATLVNKEKQPGNYEVEFNASSLSSGIYYYQLKADSYIETKKMILAK
jgi:hypothetical protein